jgi:DNA helicase HerA-like ATPase
VRSRRRIRRPSAPPPNDASNPKIKTEEAITQLGVGEALISLLDEKGAPSVVERAFILPPASRIGPLSPDERAALIGASSLRGHYSQTVDRESAYEKLQARASASQTDTGSKPAGRGAAPDQAPAKPMSQELSDLLLGRPSARRTSRGHD